MGKYEELKSDMEYEVILIDAIDASETPIERLKKKSGRINELKTGRPIK